MESSGGKKSVTLIDGRGEHLLLSPEQPRQHPGKIKRKTINNRLGKSSWESNPSLGGKAFKQSKSGKLKELVEKYSTFRKKKNHVYEPNRSYIECDSIVSSFFIKI